jgi:2-iminobutanoate/2-iminopropanoate deaminase
MSKQQITTSNTKSAHLLSSGIKSNGFIFVSGQVHANPDLTLFGDTTQEKVTKIMENIATILEAGGVTLDDIVKVVIYVTDMSVMPELNEIYPTFFKEILPVREAVCVQALPLGASIEISVIATDTTK